jgi:hypothetical protein
VGFTWVVLFWKAHEPRPSCNVVLWRNRTPCKSTSCLTSSGMKEVRRIEPSDVIVMSKNEITKLSRAVSVAVYQHRRESFAC